VSRSRSGARNAATLVLAVAAPIALFSGIGVGVTLVAGPPGFLVAVMVIAIGLAAVSLLVLAADNARGVAHRDE
jgi:hypothetical protein